MSSLFHIAFTYASCKVNGIGFECYLYPIFIVLHSHLHVPSYYAFSPDIGGSSYAYLLQSG